MTRSTFSSAARRLNSATTLSPGPASSVRTGTSFAPPMPPSSLIFSTQASAAFFAGIPKVLEAGPESSVTMPTRSSLGAPATLEAGVWVAAGGDRTAIRVSTLGAIMLARRFFIMLSL